MPAPSALRLFKGANWTDPTIAARFREAAGEVDSAQLLQLFEFLARLPDDTDPVAFRNRADAFVSIVEAHGDGWRVGPHRR